MKLIALIAPVLLLAALADAWHVEFCTEKDGGGKCARFYSKIDRNGCYNLPEQVAGKVKYISAQPTGETVGYYGKGNCKKGSYLHGCTIKSCENNWSTQKIYSLKSELSSFGYTRYTYTCSRRHFARQLDADTRPKPARTRPRATPAADQEHGYANQHTSAAGPLIHQESDPLLAAYISLLAARIPCHWRYADHGRAQPARKTRARTLERELWVFWLADQSLLQGHGLEELRECHSGILAWDSILQNNTPVSVGTPQTPMPSTAPSSTAPPSSDATSAGQEYETFICGLRNVLDRGMVAKGGYRLGDSYVFPASLQPKLGESVLPSFPEMPSIPHGTAAVLRQRGASEFTEEQTQRCLEGWADLFGTNPELVNDMARTLPRLVTVSVGSGANTVLLQYPTERVFVPVSCKESPSDVGQLDGMGSRSLGFIEDLGAKYALWTWQERASNAIASPAVPKLVQAVPEHTPVLAEPRNRLKANSSAWQQQQQQQLQASFLQQQQDAITKRVGSSGAYDTNRIDYWAYTDPYAYLTSIVLNSCANAEPKGPDSPSAADNSQATVVVPSEPSKVSKSKAASKPAKSTSAETDGWIRKRPKPSTSVIQRSASIGDTATEESNQAVWSNNSTSMQATEGESSYSNTDQFDSITKAVTTATDTQSANASMNSSSYQLPIDLPADNSDMMSGLMDMNSMLGLYGAGNSDDLDDWGEVTKDDFSYFDEQPRSAAPTRSLPMATSAAFDSQTLQSSIPMTSSNLAGIAEPTSISSTNGLMSAFSEPPDPFSKMMTTTSPMDDDSLFANMDLDLTGFEPITSASAVMPTASGDKVALATTPSIISLSPSADQFLLGQIPHSSSILTPILQEDMSDKVQSHQAPGSQLEHPQQPSPQPPLQPITTEQPLVRTPSVMVRHVHSPLQSYIPSSFSPLKIVGDFMVDVSKYQAGGRYAYKRLYKRRRSSFRDPLILDSRGSKMLPFYQPGKDQEWIIPVRKERIRKPMARQFSLSVNWREVKKEGEQKHSGTGSPVTKQDAQSKRSTLGGRSYSVPAMTAWGISSLSLHTPLETAREEEGSSSGSDDDSSSSSSTSDSDNDSSSSTSSLQPAHGLRSAKRIEGANGNHGAASWSTRTLNSAKVMASVWSASKDLAVDIGTIVGMDTSERSSRTQTLELDSDHDSVSKAWLSASAYHAEVEFDTPFTPAILSSAPPALVYEPLTISEGESFHVMLSRRKTMSHFLHRGVATVPALGDESFRNVMQMKSIMFELFDRLRGNPSDNAVALPIPSEATQEMTLSMGALHGHHHHLSQSNIVPPVVMKGPLTLSHYFSLAEAQQMPSKYGKYQVKKKKPAEPALVQLQPPDIVVGHNEEWLEAAPTILRFWEKLSLEPYSSKKTIAYFVVYPEGADMERSVTKFWRELSVVFETSLLGRHQPGTLQDYKPGLVPIPLLAAMEGEAMEARQVRSYVDGCQRLGSVLGGISQHRDVHTVVYMVNPFSHGAGYFDLCRCFSIMKTQFLTAALGSLLTPLEQQRERLVMQVVPIQHVLYPSTFGGYLRFGLKDIAFTVYTRCKIFLERPTYAPGNMAQINAYAPSFALAKPTPATIQFDVRHSPNSVPKPVATLHVGYGFSLDGRWLICVWTDHRGEMLEHMALDMSDATNRVLVTYHSGESKTHRSSNGSTSDRNSSGSESDSKEKKNSRSGGGADGDGSGTGRLDQLLFSSLQEIWARTLIYQKRGSFSWKTVVCKLGLMSRVELQEWTRLTEGTDHTAIVAVNIDSPLRVYPHSHGAEYLSSGLTPTASGISASSASGAAGAATPLIASTPLAQSILANSGSTPDVPSTGPATPMSGGSSGLNHTGATGLGIAGTSASSASFGSHNNAHSQAVTAAAGSGAMGGIGGLSGSEMLENSAGQVYAMILSHRMPLIVTRESAGLEAVAGVFKRRLEQCPNQTPARVMMPKEEEQQQIKVEEYDQETTGVLLQEDTDMKDGDMSKTPPVKDEGHQDNEDQDQDMEPVIKREDPATLFEDESKEKKIHPALTTPVHQESSVAGANDVVLPLSTGYLIQVPIQSNSVMREKHSLEALGVEVHLLHLHRRTTTTSGSTLSGSDAASGPTGTHGRVGSSSAKGSSPARGSPYQQHQQQHSTAYHMQRHTPASPSTPGYQPYRPSGSSGSSSQYPGSSPAISSPSSFGAGQNQAGSSAAGGGATGGVGTGATTGGAGAGAGAAVRTIKSTVAASTTRDILKQFHALSYLSMSAAPVQTNCLPNHLVLVERLSRVLLLVQE
ncbi:mediator of RNA polymerase II transcription subunit 13 [Mortierella antarctica]|nr:mediator of RNA polymerase II transcription subunit 13 [Mortierella antarctica]